jgi:hypothetical protein
MKVLMQIVASLCLSFSLFGQDTLPWIQRPENASFLAKVDSVFELRFKKKMDLFPVMDAGALNFARCEAQVGECTKEYIYNESYLHEMMTFTSPVGDYTVESLIKVIETAGDDPSIASYMYLLDPDKYWIGYYEIGGKFLLVTCLSVDREKVYAEMGLRYGK